MSDYKDKVERAIKAGKTFASPSRLQNDLDALLDRRMRRLHAETRAGKTPDYDSLSADELASLEKRARRRLAEEDRARLKRQLAR